MNAVIKVKKELRERLRLVRKKVRARSLRLIKKIKQSIPRRMLAGCACVVEERIYLSSWIWHVMIYTRFIAYYNKLEVPVAWIYKFFSSYAHTPHIRTYIHASHTHVRSAINNVTFNKRCHAAREENYLGVVYNDRKKGANPVDVTRLLISCRRSVS